MIIKLIAHTQLSESFKEEIKYNIDFEYNERAAIALSAIRCCYSPNKPSEIISLEGKKYFGNKATDGQGGTEADRLFRHITGSGHTSTLEHLTYTFALEGVSRALLAQLTRHRHLSFSVQSQRYVRLGSNDKSGGFEHVVPRSIDDNADAYRIYEVALNDLQGVYDELRECGVPAEDARMVLPNAATTNIVMTGNLRTLLDFYSKRKPGKGAQYEITQLAEGIKSAILEVDPWIEKYFS
ncbi:FAD-dependent thymidylate synthase [Paenibacillus donghaensis]|uniref:FAD-dependent thymidylate synthase n=1 Tax=Paenibacillus donghaensis TaxID=414771 RepID=A0A2Z2KAQ9_9BACL|nr:FAD-dependent thymidylate synthase [Paenibacillus donghaensis]ASA22577.1 thymidylate synthase (FAD) [Paenibacillus donghaensis]